MMVSMQYGAATVSAPLTWARCLGTLDAAERPALPDVALALKHALEHPIGMDSTLRRRFHPGDTVIIVVSDATRRTGMEQVLPTLVAWLLENGIAEKALSFLIATGVHRPSTDAEKECILGKCLYERFRSRIFNHDARATADLVPVGVTRRGAAVTLNRRACECDHLILTGTVMPHYFAGFGGGRKALMPGLAGAGTIVANHALSLHPTEARLDPRVRICALDDNPVAEDMLEGARLRPPAFIVNTVLGRDGAIVGLFAGELDAAHRCACALAKEIYTTPVSEQADLIIAAMNNAPNFIQCHKALFNAYSALKPGGRIILLAPMSEGLGGGGFRRYLEMGDAQTVAAALRKNPDINGQTVLSALGKAPHALFVTELNDRDVNLLGAEKAASLDDALQRVHHYFLERNVQNPTCHLMPNAGNTVPV